MRSKKVIVLIEEKWWSHHPYWFKYIFRFFLENTDRHIVIFASFNDTITGWLSEEFSIYRGRVSLEYLRWQKTLVKRSTNRIYNFALKCWPWLRLRKKLKHLAAKKGVEIEFVYMASIDEVMHTCLQTSICNRLFPYQWSGLYHRPIHADAIVAGCSPDRVSRVTKMDGCIGIQSFQENYIEEMTRDFEVPVQYFPEIIEFSSNPPKCELAETIKQKAKGRKVIGLMGLINFYKGILTMLEVARHMQNDSYYFVFLGNNDVVNGDLCLDEIKKHFAQYNLSNCFTHFEYIPDTGPFDSILQTFDLVWAAFEDYPWARENYPWSSNTLTKAAYHGKPIIVSEGGLMGYRVEQYNLGFSIKPGSSLDAYLKIKEHFEKGVETEYGFEEYMKLNSVETLNCMFHQLLDARGSFKG